MKRIFCFFVLLTVWLSVSAQDLCIEGNELNMPDHISVKDVRAITHAFSQDGTPLVQIQKNNGTEYSFATAAMPELKVKSYTDAVLDEQRYADMKCVYGRRVQDIQSLNDGDLLGLFNEMDFSLDEYILNAYKNSPSVDTIMQVMMNLNETQLLAKTGIKHDNIRVRKQSFAYVSTDTDGAKIMLTANIVYPYSTSIKTLACEDMLLDNHLTLVNSSKAPSLMMCSSTMLHGAATRGLCVVQPDLYGHGASRSRTQQYVDREINPRHIVDCLLAVRQFEKYSNTTVAPLNFEDKAKLIITGASQGATSALATTYYIENRTTAAQRRRLLDIKETRLCGGAYDMKLTLNEYCRSNRVVFGPIIPLLMQGVFATHHNEILDPDGQPYSIHDFMNPVLRTSKWDTTDKGLPGEHTIWEILDSKTLESLPIINAMNEVCGVVDPTIQRIGAYAETNRILSPDILVQTGANSYALNEDNPKVQAFSKVLEDNDLTDADLWIPKSDIQIIHGRDDYMVPFANAQQFYDHMNHRMLLEGHTLEFKAIDDTDSLGNHIVFCSLWGFSQVGNLSIEALMALMNFK